MEESLFRTQRKKLLAIGLFLVLVVLAVGREDEPGMVAQIAEEDAAQQLTGEPVYDDNIAVDRRAETYTDPQPAQDRDLAGWYASAGTSDEPVDPAPEDKSHLINDTQPLVSTDPTAGAQGYVLESARP